MNTFNMLVAKIKNRFTGTPCKPVAQPVHKEHPPTLALIGSQTNHNCGRVIICQTVTLNTTYRR